MILLLAGTSEARALATAMAEAGIDAIASLAGATERPAALALPTRIGGFGGREGFERYIDEHGISAVIDATHPFAAQITDRTAQVCRARWMPCLQVLRPGWQAGPGDRWTWIDREEDAAVLIPPGATVFLATGRQTLSRFAGLAGRRVLCRQIDPPTGPFPFECGEYVIGRPPFSVEAERRLFSELAVSHLVVKDAGGTASRSKLDAARDLGIAVLILHRPPMPDVDRVETVNAAMDWIKVR